ncbi:MAG: 16S rRNA methyltransferase [Candidatus Thermoplasmatota archaeon]
MLTMILAESEIELIPEEIHDHPSVRANANRRGRKPGEMILDASRHHTAMKNLDEGERRGRPDITHVFLLVTLESVLNKKGGLKVIIHTRNNEEISISSETRIIKNYDRFIGLMEQLYQEKTLPKNEKSLLTLKEDRTLSMIIKDNPADKIILCSTKGIYVDLKQYFTKLKKKKIKDILCVIGGFPKGEFHTDFNEVQGEIDVISIYPEMIPAWSVAMEIIVNYENIIHVK